MADRTPDVVLLAKAMAFELKESVEEAFAEMLDRLRRGERASLSAKQRAWVEAVLEEYEPKYENLVSAGKVPRGREVALLVKDKPLKPPGR